MRTSCFIFLCIFLFINSCLFSQGNAANPDAAGTSKQSQIPVNLSTGVPQIGFPLASLEGKSMVLQFSLGYDASGRKINESAQSTGWGWNVSGGGQIVRNIRGDKDEKHFPLGYVSDIPAGTGTPWIEDFKAQQGKYMPDEYFFNVNGLSGSFVINTEGEAVLLPYQDIKINFEFPFYFEIIDDSGFRYRFEDSSISYYGIEGEEESDGAVTAWYLSRIFDPQGQEEFYFNYEHGGYTVMKTYSIDESWYFGDNCPRSIHSENTYVSRTEILNLVLVHSNLTDKGLGFWRITPRLDEPETYCLDEIRNFKSGQFLGGVKLGYDYFKNELNQPERLKLISMSTISSDLIYEEIVSFEYNESLIIKSDERIIGQDHWGYYNGLDLSSVQDNHIHGGRRRVDPNKNQLGILKKLNYTSGKSVTLEFESNTYSESPFGSVIPQLNSPVLMTGLLQINDEDIFNYDLDDTDQGFIFSGPDQGLNFAGQPNNIFENLTGQCDFGYTFYNSSTDYSLNPEIGGDGFFAPDDLADIDHPNNGMNQDLFESEIVIFPYPKSKIQSQQFTIDNGQNITISGTIAPSFCTSLLSYISIRSTTTPAEEIWRLDGQLDYDVVFSNTMYLAEGSYIIDYVIVYPLFDGIPAGYVPRKDISGSWSTSFEFTFLPLTIPQPNNFTNYCGGLRIKSVFENAEDFTTSAGFKTEYSYNTFLDPTKSSGYLFSDPIYNDYRDYYYSSWYRNGVGCTGDTVFCSECDVLIKNSNGLNSLKLVNGSCVGYSNITVKQSELETESENGRIEYEYSVHPSDNDNLLFGFSYPYQNWRNGLLTATRVYNSTGILLQKTESEFEVISIENSSASGLGQAISQLRPLAKRKRVCVSEEVPLCDYRYSAQMLPYNYTSEIIRLKNSSSFAYDQVDPSKFSNSITHYSYQSYSPALVSKVTNYTNDPVLPVTETRIKYVGDYSSDGNGSAMKMALNHLNITVGYGKATPIETINLAGISESLLNVYSGQITTLRLVNINFPVVDASYQLVLESPISLSDFNLSSVEGALFVMNSNYRKRTGDFIYDSEANLICSQQINGIPTSKILNSENLVIAEVLNSRPGECFYNSFEVNEFNSWNYLEEAIIQQEVSVLGLTLTRSKTGLRALSLIESIQRELPAGKYTVSLWSNSPSFSLSLNGVVQTSSISNEGLDLLGWRYNEYILELESTSTIVISGGSNILIDELRVYPSDARMTTLAYNFDGSLRNKCDNNNYVTTTLYDTWLRPVWLLDDRLEILKYTEYHKRDLQDSQDRTWTKEKVVLQQGVTSSDVLNSPNSDSRFRININYFNSSGKVIQTSAVRQSGHPLRDLVTFHQYDGFGRETRRFLPFVSSASNNGEYIENPDEKVYTFYETALRVAETAYPYSEVIFESSPLSRVLEEGNVGEAWQLTSGHTVKVRNLLNENSEVLLWTNSENGCSAMSQGSPVYYPENSLSKKHVVDATGASFWEYSDLFGRVICKRTFARMNGVQDAPYTETTSTGKLIDNSNIGLPGSGPIDTQLDVYFIYDAFGRLVYEIPTIAIKAFNGNYEFSTVSNGVNYAIYNGYLTASKYDKWGRIIERKKPGEEWTLYVYNKLDQVILSKSPELSEQGNKWNYVKYDIYGRPIQTGLYTSNLNRDGLQDMADYTAIYSTIAEDRTGNASVVYTNETFPNSNLELYTETYYDDYNFDINGFTYNYIETAPEIQSKRTRGIVTGSKVKVLDDSNNYLINVQYVDRNGRSAVQFAENILGGFDKMTNIYDYQGKLLESRRYFKKSDSNVDVIHVVNRFEFDHAGRLTLTKQKINSDEEVTVSKLVYNDLGQVVKKHLHISGSANMGMQVIDYRYNERGWLTKINNSDLTNDGDNMESWDVFGEELIYHNIEDYNSSTMQFIAQYGGNISATKWKTNISQELDAAQLGGHSYVYRYDDLGQMTGAFYAGSADDYIDNYNQNLNFWDEKVSYDSNGNVLAIHRTRGKEADGMEAVSPINVDVLSYQYNDNSNKLKSITDGGMNLWIPNTLSNSFAHFIDGNAGSDDYSYDSEGRLISDANKGLEYTYNHLDLVSSASYGSENIDFVWDASGVKHAKIVGQTVYYYFGGIEYKDDVISHINTSEGIARPFDSNQLNTNWNYDYYLKDHLGNVRAVITEENSELVTEKVTVEMAVRLQEDSNFDNVSATEKDKPYLYPYDPSDVFNQKVAELSKLTGKIIGPAKVMEVKRGEKVDVSTKYWYMEEPGEPLTDLTEIIAGTLFNLSMASSSIIPQGPEMGMALLNNVNGEQFGNLNNFLSNSFEDIELDKPKAYIVYISFDKRMMLDVNNSGVIQVSDANTLGQLSKKDIIFRTDGYFYVYVTNQSEALVNFDNLTITRWKPQVRVTYDYYPFGLTWENPKLEDTEEGLHDHTCQDKEFLFAEFADGRGLELLDFHSRMYDPTTCRWSVPDPAAQFANPYLAMGNSPTNGVDPDGKFYLQDDLIIGSVAFAAGYVSTGLSEGNWGKEALLSGATWAFAALVSYNTMGIASAPSLALEWGTQFAATQIVSGLMPQFNLAIGKDLSLSFSPAIIFGSEGFGAGGNFGVNYTNGTTAISFGFGSTYYDKAWGTNSKMTENRVFGGIKTGNWSFGLTSFKGGGIDQYNWQIGFDDDHFSASMDEDFKFSDKFRTGLLQVGYQFNDDFELSTGFKIFTGDPNPLNASDEEKYGPEFDGIACKPHQFNVDGNDFRSGILYGNIRYKDFNYSGGWSSERIRYAIQNQGIHNQTKDPYFPYVHYNPHYYFRIGTYHPFTLY